MSNFFEWTKPNEDEGVPGGKDIDLNYGLDTDNAQYDEDYNFLGNEETPMVGVRYGDYDVRRAGVGSAGSGLIVPPEPDSGVPNMDDYITVPDSKTDRAGIYMKDFLSGNQSDSLDIMTEGVYNGRVLDLKIIEQYEKELLSYAEQKLKDIPELTIYGNSKKKGPVISFNLKNIHPHDVSHLLDTFGIAIRAGHHCAQPIMKKLNVAATNRASFYFYNTFEEIDKCSTIGISSGASAPEILVNNFINNLKEKYDVEIEEVEIIKENIIFKIPKKLN